MHRAHQLPVGDFPDVTKFRNTMLGHELTKFPKLDSRQVEVLESVLSVDIPRLLAMFPQEGTGSSKAMSDTMSHVETAQPAPALMPPSAPAPAPAPAPPPPPAAPALMPPAAAAPGPFDAAPANVPWAVTPADKARYEEIFASLAPQNGLVSGSGSRCFSC